MTEGAIDPAEAVVRSGVAASWTIVLRNVTERRTPWFALHCGDFSLEIWQETGDV